MSVNNQTGVYDESHRIVNPVSSDDLPIPDGYHRVGSSDPCKIGIREESCTQTSVMGVNLS